MGRLGISNLDSWVEYMDDHGAVWIDTYNGLGGRTFVQDSCSYSARMGYAAAFGNAE